MPLRIDPKEILIYLGRICSLDLGPNRMLVFYVRISIREEILLESKDQDFVTSSAILEKNVPTAPDCVR